MNIIIPLEGRVMTVIHTSFLLARKTSATEYSLNGDAFQMAGVTSGQVLILPDDVPVTENDLISDETRARALPLETFIAASAEEAMADALGLVLRAAVADGRITDDELLRVAPVLEGRQWQPGIEVAVGDVYAFGVFLWRCVQAHTTQEGWPPDLTPALWRKVEIVSHDDARVWEAGIEYVTGNALAYLDKDSTKYKCLQDHTSREGWEPPNAPALWLPKAG